MADPRFNVDNLALLNGIEGSRFRSVLPVFRWYIFSFLGFPVWRHDPPVVHIKICNNKWYTICLIEVRWITYRFSGSFYEIYVYS